MTRSQLALVLGLLSSISSSSALAEAKNFPLGPPPDAYVTEATLAQEMAGLDAQTARVLEQQAFASATQAPLREYDKQVLEADQAAQDARDAPAPVVRDGRVMLTYNKPAKATIVCTPFRQCLVQLKTGETVTDMNESDTRWEVLPSMSGLTTYLVIKPLTQQLIESDLTVFTDQRVYSFALRTDPKVHMSMVAFDYPAERKEAQREFIRRQQQRAAEQTKEAKPTREDRLVSVELDKLNARYEIEFKHPRFCRMRHNCITWAPTKVVDDGRRTWITMPVTVQAQKLPALFVQTRAGLELVDYRFKRESSTYYVDRVFAVGKLMLGVNGAEGTVTIVRKAQVGR